MKSLLTIFTLLMLSTPSTACFATRNAANVIVDDSSSTEEPVTDVPTDAPTDAPSAECSPSLLTLGSVGENGQIDVTSSNYVTDAASMSATITISCTGTIPSLVQMEFFPEGVTNPFIPEATSPTIVVSLTCSYAADQWIWTEQGIDVPVDSVVCQQTVL